MSHYKVARTGEVLDRATDKLLGTVRKDGKHWRAILPGMASSIIRYNTRQGAADALSHVR